MEKRVDHQVIIIGAGPAGLILGYYLKSLGINYLILDKNMTAGSSWTQMPDQLRLISHWQSNCLLPEDLKLFPRDTVHKAKDFAEYLIQFSKRHALTIEFQKDVVDFLKDDDRFIINTPDKTYHSDFLIDCRGHFNFPFIPPLDISGNPPFMLHFKDYKNAEQFKNYKKILIVGKRLSAGQILNELAASDDHELFISARSEVKFSSHPVIYNYFLSHLDFIESVIKKIKSNLKNEVEVPMHFNARKVFETRTVLKKDIKKIVNHDVTFQDSSTEKIDAIIYTTGFKPPKAVLKNDFESVDEDGLFYLGRNSQRTFTSRFLRGIREDAQVLSGILLSRLASRNKRQ
ncbi:MAG: NAD(P)/FAD-dependent oxidoreductase [Rhizobacter sp.]|nr:NAD(P)/FAD-dependent oxidoreductase [Bacteriovorax sp.]